MVDFDTLKGVDGYRAAFPEVFDRMSDADTKQVVRAVHSSVLSGREPTAEEMQASADRILNRRPGGLTSADVEEILAQVRQRSRRR
ncbi:hypothetical protein BJF89_16020 [Corynebacterium sp. CNJ-954]|uniref:hypothetical protein n=1 Tax=Corynebacterium sp. CNJ-954 TaxID=1904962 RepID=UPI00095A0612|nr:hypothetical protein [Corynebacterium sp. CNJ-954]OLT55260.1 hypothetical protein BJF89_16020 [Corynebacterium sp. CNJ-954]